MRTGKVANPRTARDGREDRTRGRSSIQACEVLDDGCAGAQQDSMGSSLPGGHVVDVYPANPDRQGAAFQRKARQVMAVAEAVRWRVQTGARDRCRCWQPCSPAGSRTRYRMRSGHGGVEPEVFTDTSGPGKLWKVII